MTIPYGPTLDDLAIDNAEDLDRRRADAPTCRRQAEVAHRVRRPACVPIHNKIALGNLRAFADGLRLAIEFRAQPGVNQRPRIGFGNGAV